MNPRWLLGQQPEAVSRGAHTQQERQKVKRQAIFKKYVVGLGKSEVVGIDRCPWHGVNDAVLLSPASVVFTNIDRQHIWATRLTLHSPAPNHQALAERIYMGMSGDRLRTIVQPPQSFPAGIGKRSVEQSAIQAFLTHRF